MQIKQAARYRRCTAHHCFCGVFDATCTLCRTKRVLYAQNFPCAKPLRNDKGWGL